MSESPSWAMSGQAIDGREDSHLAEGTHLRIVTNPLLGLPICPIVVDRVTLNVKSLLRYTRSDAIWVDARGALLTPPFAITADNPVTAYLPRSACWAMVSATAAPTRWPFPVVGPVRDPIRLPGTIRDPIGTLPGAGPMVRLPQKQAPLRVEAMVTTPLGSAPVAVRSRAPYQVYASHIERVVITGTGTVNGLRWLDPTRAPGGKPWHTLPLPCPPGARYAGPADGWDRGLQRAHDAAPTRLGMHEQPQASGPSACDPVGAGDEWSRVEHLGRQLVDDG